MEQPKIAAHSSLSRVKDEGHREGWDDVDFHGRGMDCPDLEDVLTLPLQPSGDALVNTTVASVTVTVFLKPKPRRPGRDRERDMGTVRADLHLCAETCT